MHNNNNIRCGGEMSVFNAAAAAAASDPKYVCVLSAADVVVVASKRASAVTTSHTSQSDCRRGAEKECECVCSYAGKHTRNGRPREMRK